MTTQTELLRQMLELTANRLDREALEYLFNTDGRFRLQEYAAEVRAALAQPEQQNVENSMKMECVMKKKVDFWLLVAASLYAANLLFWLFLAVSKI